MNSQNPYEAVGNKLQDIEQYPSLNTIPANNGQPMYNINLQPMASAPSVPQNIGQNELDSILVRNEPPMNEGESSAPAMPKQPTLGPTSKNMICTHCQSNIYTLVNYRPSNWTHILGLLLCTIGYCWLPYIMDSCRIANHNCPKCNAFLGTYSK